MANTLKFGNGNWATKKGSTLAYNDENGNFKPLPFDFSRGSTPTGSKATTINKDGLIEEVGNNIPRIDYKDNSEGALLLEPSRTNLITYSEDFNNTYLTKSGSSAKSEFASPSGDLIAFKLVENIDTVEHYIKRSIANPIGFYTWSLFVKAGGRKYIVFRTNADGGAYKNACFDVESGTIVYDGLHQSKAEIQSFNNGWFRVSAYVKETSGTTRNYQIHISDSPITDNGAISYTGNGVSGVYIYGAQLETGSYATSYIPTSGSAVTRLVDVCSQTVPDGVIGQTEGTMFVDCKINAQGTYTGFSLSDGTTSNEVIVRFTTTDRIEYYLRSGGSQPFGGGTTAFDTDSRVKVAIAYKSGDSVFYVNGTEVASSTNTTIPLNLSKVKFSRGNSTADFSGITKNFKVYNTRLSNSELAALTQV